MIEINVPFTTPVGVSDISEHLPYLRKLFVDRADEMQIAVHPEINNRFKTTMDAYGPFNWTNNLDDSPESTKLKETIYLAAKEYANACGNAGDKYEPFIVNFWLNEMESGQAHVFHNHSGGMHFSGCIYIDMPENAAGITFKSFRDRFDYIPIAEETYTTFNSSTWKFSPTEGQLYIWESWMMHAVQPSTFEGIRRSAAFDVVMKRIVQKDK